MSSLLSVVLSWLLLCVVCVFSVVGSVTDVRVVADVGKDNLWGAVDRTVWGVVHRTVWGAVDNVGCASVVCGVG